MGRRGSIGAVKLYNSMGDEVDATFSAHLSEQNVWTVIFECRGPGRNTEYAKGLELLLGRCAEAGAILDEAVVISERTKHLSHESRRIHLGGFDLPLALAALSSFYSLRTAMSSGMAQVGRARHAKPGGGNGTKRIALKLRCQEWSGRASESIEIELARGRTSHA